MITSHILSSKVCSYAVFPSKFLLTFFRRRSWALALKGDKLFHSRILSLMNLLADNFKNFLVNAVFTRSRPVPSANWSSTPALSSRSPSSPVSLSLEGDFPTFTRTWLDHCLLARGSVISSPWLIEPPDGQRLFLCPPSLLRPVLGPLLLPGSQGLESQLSWPLIEVLSSPPWSGLRFALESPGSRLKFSSSEQRYDWEVS